MIQKFVNFEPYQTLNPTEILGMQAENYTLQETDK